MPAPYPLEFRREAVELLRRSDGSMPQLAAELGVSPQSLRNWAHQLLSEVLLLTKMNWNSARFAERVPVTLRFAGQVGSILRDLAETGPPAPVEMWTT